MMESLATLDVGGKGWASVTQMIEKLHKMDEYPMQDTVQMCKIEKAYPSGTAKILIHCRDTEIRQAIVTEMHNAQKTACSGPAPAGFVEDELAPWLDTMVGDS